MKPANIAKTLAQGAWEPLESLASKTARPMLEEAGHELAPFFGTPKGIANREREIAAEELKRAREKEKLNESTAQDTKKSHEEAQRVQAVLLEYRQQETKGESQQQQLKEQVAELQGEIVKLAKTAGVETKAHLAGSGKKIGLLDIKILTTIVRFLRLRAEESKSAQELVSQRTNAKRTTGMMAWVSGKQMKVHEQGTLQLQG